MSFQLFLHECPSVRTRHRARCDAHKIIFPDVGSRSRLIWSFQRLPDASSRYPRTRSRIVRVIGPAALPLSALRRGMHGVARRAEFHVVPFFAITLPPGRGRSTWTGQRTLRLRRDRAPNDFSLRRCFSRAIIRRSGIIKRETCRFRWSRQTSRRNREKCERTVKERGRERERERGKETSARHNDDDDDGEFEGTECGRGHKWHNMVVKWGRRMTGVGYTGWHCGSLAPRCPSRPSHPLRLPAGEPPPPPPLLLSSPFSSSCSTTVSPFGPLRSLAAAPYRLSAARNAVFISVRARRLTLARARPSLQMLITGLASAFVIVCRCSAAR